MQLSCKWTLKDEGDIGGTGDCGLGFPANYALLFTVLQFTVLFVVFADTLNHVALTA